MSDIFISHVEEDSDVAIELALRLEEAGYRTWSYEIDSIPGPSYLIQTGRAIEQSAAVVLIISSCSLRSNQLTREVVRAHESGKHFIPVLRDVTHAEFQNRQPEWREAIGAAASIRIPQEGVAAMLARIVEGLRALDIRPRARPDTKRIEVISKALGELESGAITGEGTKVVPVAKSGERPSSTRGTRPWLIVLISVILIALIVFAVVLPKGLLVMIVLGLAILAALIVWRRQIGARLKTLRQIVVMSLRGRRRQIRLLLIALALAAIVAAIVVPMLVLGTGNGKQGGSSGNATPTPTPTATPISKADILSFSDNFQDGLADGWQLGPGWSVALVNGNYLLEAKTQESYSSAWPLMSSASNYVLEADFEIVSGGFEFDVRQIWGGTHYNVWIYENAVQLGRCIGPPSQPLLNEWANIGYGQWHNLSIALDGGSIKVYIDHQLKIDYLDEEPLPAGSFIIISNPNSIIRLDNIMVKTISAPTVTPATTPGPSESVTFADLNLEMAIRNAIGKQRGNISASDLKGLTWLEANSAGITDLSGLEYCKSLGALSLADNEIVDIIPLSGLINLTSIILNFNQISDISPLSNLTNLQVLHIGNNQISDISALSNLHNLTSLSLNSNPTSEFSYLSNLTSLVSLFLQNNNINNISFLSSFTKLQVLRLDNNQIQATSQLAELTNLTELYLPYNQITELSFLSNLTRLTHLELAKNQIVDISSLASLNTLRYLDLCGNKIIDISPLSTLTGLTQLFLSGNPIKDIVSISDLTNIESLELVNNGILDIYPLVENGGLGEGDWVDLRDNPLNSTSVNSFIPQLKQRGVTVWSN